MEKLLYTLKPRWEGDTVASMEITGEVNAAILPADGPGLDYCAEGFGKIVPFPEYDGLSITDNLGEVPYTLRDTPGKSDMVQNKGIFFDRPLQGTLRWTYRIYPRVLPEGYRSSPYYDFRAEPYGLNGSGMFSFILPQDDVRFRFCLHWDMAEMPSEARGVWAYGCGDVEREMTAWDVRFSYYAVGVMNAEEEDEFGIYWFGEPTFDVRSVAQYLKDLFAYMKDFFRDDNPRYRIFLRRDPFEISGGGSAAGRSFISGYSATGTMDRERWRCTLAHEMVHNWPYMDDRVAGTGTWYTEGCAEYYSAVLPYRGGFVGAEYTAQQINKKAVERYYTNVYREMPNMEIPAIQWQDRRAQTVPYGRGFVYLGNVEAQLKRAGKGSIDEFTTKYSWDNPSTPELWMEFIRERLGEPGIREFEDMTAGKLLTPDPEGYGGDFAVVEEEIDLDGKQAPSYRWEVKRA